MSANENSENWPVTVDSAALSDTGMRRRNNQDSFAVMLAENSEFWRQAGHVFVVADGMGAHAAGELASRLAVEQITHHLGRIQQMTPVEGLERAVTEANNEIYRRGQANAEFRNMGTTVSVLSLLPEGAVAAHVGDSRVYRLRGSQLEQLTFDHSLVWEMQASGDVNEDAIRSGLIPKNVITRSLGPNPFVRVDLEGPFPIKKGDRFLVCSDGLTGPITDYELGVLMQVLSPQEAVRVMVDLANLRGGPDNITAIVVDVNDPKMITSEPTVSPAENSRSASPKFSIPLVVVSLLCVLAAVGFAYNQNWPLAVITLILGAVAMATGVFQFRKALPLQPEVNLSYGKGPHRRYHCVADQEMVDLFTQTIQSLREAAEENHWAVRWPEIELRNEQGRKAELSSNFNLAVKYYATAIIEIMQQVRDSSSKSASDSAVDY